MMEAFFCHLASADHLRGAIEWHRKTEFPAAFWMQLPGLQAVRCDCTEYTQSKYSWCVNPVDKVFFQSSFVVCLRQMKHCGKENGKIAIESFLMKCYYYEAEAVSCGIRTRRKWTSLGWHGLFVCWRISDRGEIAAGGRICPAAFFQGATDIRRRPEAKRK